MFTNNFYQLLKSYILMPTSGNFKVTFFDNANNSVLDAACAANSSSQVCNSLNWALYQSSNSQLKPNTFKSALMAAICNGTNVYHNVYSATYADIAGCVILGDGDTAPTVNDVALSGNLITDFSATTSINVNDSDGIVLTAQYDITNTGASAFTVKEIALTRCGITTSLVSGNYIMLERTVLSAPVTIQPSETKSIIYRIKFI